MGASLPPALEVGSILQGENLKIGMGAPWAGHESSNGLPESASRAETVLFRVNLGEDPPTGSVKETLNLNSPI